MNHHPRSFPIKQAVREKVPLLIGLMGPSGGGKTFSALRLATGIQSVSGGEIHFIDTEARRALHYADRFNFQHIQFDAPFGSLDYLDVISASVRAGAGVVIVDSMSHEHSGPGGMIDLQEQEMDRMAGDDFAKRERIKMLAWAKPKAARRRLIDGILQLNTNFIFCFRGKETAKPVKRNGKTEVESQGFMPIAGDEFVFEMTLNCLLLPRSNGIPTWQTDKPGERIMMKLPAQFEKLADRQKPLDETVGKHLAEWAKGGAVQVASMDAMKQDAAPTQEPISDNQPEEVESDFGPADAHAQGMQARKDGKQRKAIPGEWRDGTPEHEAWIAAWQAGWDAEDEERKAKMRA